MAFSKLVSVLLHTRNPIPSVMLVRPHDGATTAALVKASAMASVASHPPNYLSAVMNLRAGAGATQAATAGSSMVLRNMPNQIMAFRVSLSLATFFCTTVFGMMLFAAAAFMPGLAQLDNAEFLRAFQQVDRFFQKGRPLLMINWFGSLFSMLATAKFGTRVLSSLWLLLKESSADGEKPLGIGTFLQRPILLNVITLLFVAGHITTVAINLPLNNHLQTLNISELNSQQAAHERIRFERPWVRANWFRVIAFGLTSAYLSALAVFGNIGAAATALAN